MVFSACGADTAPQTTCEGDDCEEDASTTGGGGSDGCDVDSDCPTGRECDNGTCVAPTCETDADCAGNQVCNSGRCYSRAVDTGSTSGGTTGDDAETVDAGDTTSTEGDGDGSESCEGCWFQVEDAGQTCVAGDRPEGCGTGGEMCKTCEEGEICEEGECVPKPCTPSNCSGCCVDGECKDGTSDQACGTDGDQCTDCGSDSVCNGGTCELKCSESCSGCCDQDGNCIESTSDSQCGTDGAACEDCSFDETCSSGGCVLKDCQERCTTGCCSGDTCESGTSDTACGSSGDSCTTCPDGHSCESLFTGGGSCQVDGNSRWDVIAVSGEVPEDRKTNCGRGQTCDTKWDSFSKPDVFLKITVNGSTQTYSDRTSTIDDDLTPEWRETVLSDVKADDLRSFNDTELRLVDDDVVSNDFIADCDIYFRSSQFDGNTHTFDCEEEHAGETITPTVDLRLEYHP